MSKSYDIYRESVGGVTMAGDKMKDINELPEKVRNAWKSIDDFYTDMYKELHAGMMAVCIEEFKKNIYVFKRDDDENKSEF